MNDTKATVLREHHLKSLKLPTVLREYVPVAAAHEVGPRHESTRTIAQHY